MKKTYLFCLVALTLGLTACENYFDEKYMDNGDPQISLVTTTYYTLTNTDYSTIAGNATNKNRAAELDSIEGTTAHTEALEKVGKEHRFDTTFAQAKLFLPTFLYNKYPHLDKGSVFKLTYRVFEGTPKFLRIYEGTTQYELKAADYAAIWGNNSTKYVTPATEAQVANYLPNLEPDAFLGVKYAYSSKEPDAGGAVETTKEVLYVFKDGMTWEPYTRNDYKFILLPAAANGQTEKYLSNTYPYAQADDSLVVLSYSTKTKVYDAAEYKFDGSQWLVNDGIVEETVSYGLDEIWAELPVYYKQAIAGDGDQGEIVTQDFDLEEGITFIWAFNNSYGMKGSAYYSGPHYGEGWFVTPSFLLKNAHEPALSFEHAVNYGPTDESRYTQLTVWVSTDYVDDVRTATWTQLPWNEWNADASTGFPDANSWTFYNSGRMDLSAWCNQTIVIGFRYKSEPGQTCSTWEVKNIIVNEP